MAALKKHVRYGHLAVEALFIIQLIVYIYTIEKKNEQHLMFKR